MRPTHRATLWSTALLLILGLSLPAMATADTQSDTVTIDPGAHASVQIDFTDGPSQQITYDIQVTEGPNIDVLVMNNANYQKYQDGDAFSYEAGFSDLDTGNTDESFTLQEHGTWWIVLDHTGEPEDGTDPATLGAESVTASYTVETATDVKQAAEDTANDLPGPSIIVTAALVATVAACAAVWRR